MAGLTNQLGIRPVVMGGAIVTALCYVASAFSPSIYLVMISYGIIGGLILFITSNFVLNLLSKVS